MYDIINNWIKELILWLYEESNSLNVNILLWGIQRLIYLENHFQFFIKKNIQSIELHIDKFSIIALSETKLKDEPTVNISLPGYCKPLHAFTEATKGGVCLMT